MTKFDRWEWTRWCDFFKEISIFFILQIIWIQHNIYFQYRSSSWKIHWKGRTISENWIANVFFQFLIDKNSASPAMKCSCSRRVVGKMFDKILKEGLSLHDFFPSSSSLLVVAWLEFESQKCETSSRHISIFSVASRVHKTTV